MADRPAQIDIRRSPRRISLRRNEKFLEVKSPQQVELNLPERCVRKQNRRFVLPMRSDSPPASNTALIFI